MGRSIRVRKNNLLELYGGTSKGSKRASAQSTSNATSEAFTTLATSIAAALKPTGPVSKKGPRVKLAYLLVTYQEKFLNQMEIICVIVEP